MKLYAFADEASPNIDRQIEAMKRNRLEGLEIRGVDGTSISSITLEKAREVRSKLDAAGLYTWCIGSPIGKIDLQAGDFPTHLETFRHTLELAHVLGAKNIRLFSFFIPQGQAPEAWREEVIRRLQAFVELARGTGIDLCHENEKGIYGDNAQRCLELHQAVPELKAVFDPANFVQCGQNTLEAWALLHPYVKYMHIKDAMPDGVVVPAGMGAGNVPALLAAYRDQGGSALTIEPHLAAFVGFQELEHAADGAQRRFSYRSNDEAFDAACDALRALL